MISDANGDLRELEALTGALRAKLLGVDVAAVESAEDQDLPEEAKGSRRDWLADESVRHGGQPALRV
jgi:hypothetical protein